MTTYKVTLPFPPSVNGMLGGGSGQRRFKSKKYVAWLKRCQKLEPLLLTNVEIHYSFYFPDNRVRDLGNYEKVCGDFLVSEKVLIDDCWHVIGYITLRAMGIDKKNARVEIIIVDKSKHEVEL
jgi:Holliday junction resolvase RusA-like endonuclease